MIQQRLESLRSAGVEWLPVGAGPSVVPTSGAANELISETVVEADPLTEIKQELQVLAEEVSRCERCPNLASTRTQTVFGVGRPSPEVCFVGEAPGADEDAQGEPFVGAAGQLLTRIIAAMGMQREQVYICNILKCRPPGNRTPSADEAANCRAFLERQLELVQPKILCALGATAAKYLLGTNLSVGKLRGRVLSYNDVPVVVTYHPAYLLPHRSNSQEEINSKKRLVWDDMKFLLTQLGRPIEGS